jgi:hypothetical protein
MRRHHNLNGYLFHIDLTEVNITPQSLMKVNNFANYPR